MRTTIAISLLSLLMPALALANGYEVYAPPLVWSPDGRLLAYAICSAGMNSSMLAEEGLWVYDSEGNEQLHVSGAAASPCFSPDGALLAVVHGSWLRFYDLADGTVRSGRSILWEREAILDCRWAPRAKADNPQILYFTSGERFYGCGFGTYNLANGEVQWVKAAVEDRSAFAPAPSPAGEFLCYLEQFGYGGDWAYERLMVIDDGHPAGRQATLAQPLDGSDYHESNPVFLTSSAVIFQRGGWGDWNLYRLKLRPGVDRLLALSGSGERLEVADAQQPSVSANGRWLAFTRRDSEEKARLEYDWEIPPSVWLRDRFLKQEWQVSDPGVEVAFPAISPDGDHLAWLEYDTTGPRMVIRSRIQLMGRANHHSLAVIRGRASSPHSVP
ncbi:PD40 domain-containing protein [bacterium]|nr:PD40 domain-containing protein [bacterium]